MRKKTKIAVFFIGIVVLAVIVKFILDLPVRNQIPLLPDMGLYSVSQKKQLKSASFKAHINPTADNLGKLGMVYHSGSDYERASVCYQLAINENDSKWIWSYYLGCLNKEMGETANSIKNFQKVIQKNPKVYHAWYYLGEAHQNMGENKKAKVAFEKITPWTVNNADKNNSSHIDYFPLYVYTKCRLATLYLNSDRADLAESKLNEITTNYKTFGWAYRLLGRAYRMQGDTVLSNKSVLRANDLLSLTYPVDTLLDKIALESRSELYLLKQIDEAERMRYAAWELLLIEHGLKYLADNKYLKAKAIILYLRTNRAKQALPYLQEHFEFFKDDAYQLIQVANLLFNERYFAQSNLYYKRIIALEPENTELQVSLVLGLYNQREKEKAISQMKEFIGMDDKNPKVYANAVVELIAMEEYERAETYLNKLQQLSPFDSKTFFLLGKLAYEEGNLSEARSFYESSFKKNPKDLITVKALGDLLLREKLWQKANDHFERSLELFPNEPAIMETFGTFLVRCPDEALRNYREGKEYLERAFFHKNCPSETMVVAGKSLADAYFALGDSKTASAYLNLAIDWAKNIGVAPEYVNLLEQKLKELK